MADAEVMKAIRDRADTRARRVYAVMYGGQDADREALRDGLADALTELAASWREEAELWTDSKRRGWQSTATELRQAAARVAGVAANVREIKVYSLSDSVPGAAPGADLPDDTPVAVTRGGDVTAYLSGQTDQMPADLTPVKVDVEPITTLDDEPTVNPPLHDEIKGEQMAERAAADPFIDPTPPTRSAPIALGPKWTFEDLMRPTSRQPPPHLSWSQMETIEDCGLKYRLQRVENLPQVPQWALVGGTAIHKVIEVIERVKVGTPDTNLADFHLNQMWNQTFHTIIAETAATTVLPMDQWRASNKGAEGYTWWLTQGPEMLERYRAWRLENPHPVLTINGQPVIEYETEINVYGVPVKIVIDLAFDMPNGILIVDYKSGKGQPADTDQLGLYGHAIAQAINTSVDILGTYLDLRHGTAKPPVNLLDRHPFIEYVYRTHAADAQRRAGIYPPRRSTFCNGCSVQYACPVGGR